LIENNVFAKDTCALCRATFQIGKFLSLAAPKQASPYFVFICQQLKLDDNCTVAYGSTTLGPVLAQVLANADMAGYDGKVRMVYTTVVLVLVCWC
jgi:sphingomyelin phosphodiesterase